MGQLIFLVVIFSLLLLPFYYLDAAWKKSLIRKHIQGKGYKILDLSWDGPFSFNAHPFRVTYLTPLNDLYLIQCAVHRWFRIYTLPPELVEQNYHGAKTEKERIADGLGSSFKHERIFTARKIAKLETVDEQILGLLKELSLDDPEPEVREAAREALNQQG